MCLGFFSLLLLECDVDYFFFPPPLTLFELHCGGCLEATSRAYSDSVFVLYLIASIHSLVLFLHLVTNKTAI